MQSCIFQRERHARFKLAKISLEETFKSENRSLPLRQILCSSREEHARARIDKRRCNWEIANVKAANVLWTTSISVND